MWCPVLPLLVILIFPGHARKAIIPRYDCDHDIRTFPNEGNQGPVGLFPWLGMIRVTLNEGTKLRIAVTGAVLIRITFAITDAEDIVKIPNKILRERTKAMFISSDDTPWLYSIKRYEAAPDFRMKTMSSIALVELELKDDPTPLMPICWQDQNHNISYKHFAVGFTDDRYILEKIAYNMQFIDKTSCEIYYANLQMQSSKKYVPAQYECWAAMNNTRHCMWENGMILVSNYSGTWFLIGIGTRGPGCSLPVRFISVLPYVQWIESVINIAALRMGSDKMKPKVLELPAHNFNPSEHEQNNDEIQEFDGIPYRKAYNPQRNTNPDHDGVALDHDVPDLGSRRDSYSRRLYEPPSSTDRNRVWTAEKWGNDSYQEHHWKRDDIRHMDPNVLQFKQFYNKYERVKGDCTKSGHLVYREISDVVKTPNLVGYAYYKLSLIDLAMYQYTCILIRIKSRTRSDCNLWYSIARTMDEPLGMLDDTPGEVIKHYIPVGERVTPGPFESDAIYWEPHQNLEAFFKKEGDKLVPRWWMNQTMLNLYLRFDFVEDAQLVLEIWSLTGNQRTTSTKRPYLNQTRTRLKGHVANTRSTRRRTKKKNRMKKALITKMGNLTLISASNGSNYLESFCMIFISFISTFGYKGMLWFGSAF